MAEFYEVQRLSAEVMVDEFLQTCVDVEKFLGYCRECDSYTKRWSCPPFDFDPLDFWRRYQTLRLECRVLTPGPGAELKHLWDGIWQEKQKLDAELLALEADYPGSMALSAGSCKHCAKCTRPEGLPCRQPHKMRHSIEALGGDVGKTGELYFNHPLLWIKDGEMPAYLTLICGLLLPE